MRNIGKTILVSLFVFLFSAMSFAQDVSVVATAPEQVEPGQEFVVKLDFVKTGITGFARVQQQLPENVTAIEYDSKGASFSFAKQKAKFIWLKLPAEDAFTIEYKIQVPENFSGNINITDGLFTYVYDGAHQKFHIPDMIIKVEAQMVAEETAEEVVEEVIEAPTEEVVEEVVEEVTEAPAEEVMEEVAEAVVEEVVEEVAEPVEEEVLEETPEMVVEEFVVEEEVGELRIEEVVEEVVEAPAEEEVEPVVEEVVEPVFEQLEEPAYEEPVQLEEPVQENTATYDQNVVFKVQCGAFVNKKDESRLKQVLNIPVALDHEYIDPYHKYTYGKWDNYTAAKAASDKLKAEEGIESFVVCYINGKRVHVLEGIKRTNPTLYNKITAVPSV